MLGDYQLLVRHAQRLKSSTSLSMVSASDFDNFRPESGVRLFPQLA